jgi:hypothetical protein
MSKVTIGHDSCSAWTNGDQCSADCPEDIIYEAHTGMPMWPIATLVCPVIGIYVAAKTASKLIRNAS